MSVVEARSFEIEGLSRPSDIAFRESYWEWSNVGEPIEAAPPIYDHIVAKADMPTVRKTFRKAVQLVMSDKLPCNGSLSRLDEDQHKIGTLLLIDVESLQNDIRPNYIDTAIRSRSFSAQRQDTLFQLPTLEFIRACQSDVSRRNNFRPGQVNITRKYPQAEQPNQIWEYHRAAWFSLVSPFKADGSGLAHLRKSADDFPIVGNGLIDHDSLEVGRTSYRHNSARQSHSLERIRGVYAYDASQLYEEFEHQIHWIFRALGVTSQNGFK